MNIGLDTVGYVTQDLLVQRSEGGKPYVRFGLAVNNCLNGKGTVFLRCVGLDAHLVERLEAAKVRKGSCLKINGNFEPSEYQKKDGTTATELKVILTSWSFVGGGKAADASHTAPSAQEEAPVSKVPVTTLENGTQLPG